MKSLYLWAAVALIAMAAPRAYAQTSCENAEAITVATASPPLPWFSAQWYQLTLEADKTYEIAWQNTDNNGSIFVYSDCASNWVGSRYALFTVTDAATFYIEAISSIVDDKFTLSEVTDNRLCAYADDLALGAESPALPKRYQDYWFTVHLEAGAYTAEWLNGGNGTIRFCRNCGGNSLDYYGYIYTIHNTGDYLIRAYPVNDGSKFTLSEVTDNRACVNAEALAVDVASDALPQNTSLWYTVHLEKGKAYTVDWQNGEGIVEVYRNCGGNVIYSDYGDIYTITSTGDYLICAYTLDANNPIKVSEVTDNRLCAYAEPLAVDAASPPLSQDTTRWYTVHLEAGKAYTVDWQFGGGDVTAYRNCGGNSLDEYGGIYTITSTGDYLISAYTNDADNPIKVSEVTDNRACAYADALTVGTASPDLPPYTVRWYTVHLEAGKAYTAEWLSGNGEFDVFNSCGGNSLNAAYGIYTITADGDYRIRAYSYAGSRFTLSEVTDSRACINAEPLALGDASPVLPLTERNYWFKIDLDAGTTYQFKQTGGGSYYLYNACEGDWIDTDPVYTATESGTFYFRLYDWDGAFQVTVSTVEDNRLCAYAEEISLAEEVTPPATSATYWYKVDLTAGKDYVLQWASGRGSVYLYNSCGGNSLAGGSDVNYYRAPADGTYYIEVYAYNLPYVTSKFSLSEATIADEDHRLCVNAKTLATGTESEALPEDSAPYWYKLSLTEGVSYTFETTSGNVYYYLYLGGCGSNINVSLDNIPETGDYLLKVYSYAADSRFRLTELTDHRACNHALPIALNDAVTPPAASTNYWYTIDLQAGVTYSIQWTVNGFITFYNACNGNWVGSADNFDNFLAPYSGTYYIEAYSNTSGDAFTISQTDEEAVTDNSICAYAEEMALNETITPPQSAAAYWYKIDLEADKGYAFECNENGQIELTLYNACNGDWLDYTELHSGNLRYLYLSEASGTYYLRAFLNEGGSTLKVSELTAPAVQGVTINTNDFSIQKGGTYRLEAYVDAYGGAPQTVEWSVTGTASIIAADGTLAVGASETAHILVVTATATADPSKKASVLVTVTDDVLAAEVHGVIVTPDAASVVKGATQQFEATVNVQGSAAQTVDWSISGNTSSATSISPSGGLLIVAADETAATLTVTATSTADPDKYHTVTATLLTPEVLSVTVSPATASVQKGQTQQFAATVEVTYSAAQTVTWSVSGGTAATSISPSGGLLIVAADETATTLAVTATSTFDNTKKGEAQVTLTATPVTPEVVSVTVSPTPLSVQKGMQQQFTETVTVTGGAAQTVTWSVTGNASSATAISTTGVLTVAADETATTLTVTATSTVNAAKTGTATVTVTQSGTTGVFDVETRFIASIYPNPFIGSLHLKGAEGSALQVITVNGTVVHTQKLTSPDEIISLEQLPAGLYFFRVEKDGKAKTLKAVKR
ncbi:hypothetical protein FACS189430_06760 [Bacteroidia bacterium]|nr:hypothetical protein FACS189430_06760 [Bacteroidia bacterium]